jgi:hypothetical protein
MANARWQPITVPKLIGFGLGFALFLGLLFASEPGFVLVLDSANLLFHEAGHPFFGLFSNRLTVYGGTLGQLTFPVIVMGSFWCKGQPVSFAAACLWFFENWLNIARYMADSRAMVLPLVGSGDHDWNEIFSRWHVLSHDTFIAAVTRTGAWIGIAGVIVWVGWRAWQDRGRKAVDESLSLAEKLSGRKIRDK